MGGEQRIGRVIAKSHPRFVISPLGLGVLVVLICVTGVALTAMLSGALYHMAAYGVPGNVKHFGNVGILLGLIYARPWSTLRDFNAGEVATQPINITAVFWRWVAAFSLLGLAAFLLKMTSDFSRGWLVVLFVLGIPALCVIEYAMRSMVRSAISSYRLEPRRIMLIGTDAVVRQLALEANPLAHTGGRIIGAVDIEPDLLAHGLPQCIGELKTMLDRAVAQARASDVTDVVLLSDWGNTAFLDMSADAFAVLPVTLHIEAKGLVSRFSGVKTQTINGMRTAVISSLPLAQTDSAAKRMFDVIVATAAIVVLAPVFLVIASAIKLNSAGPVFFRQRRVGYNQREFRIWKFRSMTSLDDGETIIQAKREDRRVTAVGAVLRRYNLDELPQLINVLRGEMSIVGPRPHAVAHDRLFEQSVEMYPRRLNVKPGITGWAQINGFRGETDTDAKMRGRVAHDLYYVDNWSLGFDLYIIAMTVLSPKTYANAY